MPSDKRVTTFKNLHWVEKKKNHQTNRISGIGMGGRKGGWLPDKLTLILADKVEASIDKVWDVKGLSAETAHLVGRIEIFISQL